jgi:hypothetical protein
MGGGVQEPNLTLSLYKSVAPLFKLYDGQFSMLFIWLSGFLWHELELIGCCGDSLIRPRGEILSHPILWFTNTTSNLWIFA